ncbi:restriction endonuclease subunit S [Vibrio cholerae]|nr:restriction endonuclease subunit S [Vibrio cholerae]
MTGRYKAYPEYKDSGLRWLPELPSNWKVERTKRMFALKRSLVGNQSSDYQLLSLTLKGVVPRDISSGEGKIPESFDTYQKVDENDLIFCLFDMDETPRTIGISPLNGMITGAYNVYGCLESCCANYAYYYFLHIDSFKGLKPFYTGLRKVVRAETFGNIEMPCPSFEEQQKIASFLDHETAKIDTLIAKQEMLIELLKEKRQAVISHAVTKGLNPDAPMKDSGVEWLGEVPEHWDVTKFGYISQVVRGGSPRPAGDPELFNGDYSPWVTVAEITKDDEIYLTETETFLTKKGSLQCRVFTAGTLLLSNSGATLGVPSILSINANANDGVVGFENLKVNSEFAYFYLSSLTQGLRDRIKQGSGQPNLNTDIVKSISIPLPPSDEIEKIVEYIHKLRAHYRQLESKAIHGITLLKERKTALISAAVTGKIDVRDWEPQGVQDE